LPLNAWVVRGSQFASQLAVINLATVSLYTIENCFVNMVALNVWGSALKSWYIHQIVS